MAEPVPHPPSDPWTVAIHRSRSDQQPLGTGVVIDATRILTCAHVLRTEGQWRDEVWVAFPKAPGVPWQDRRRVERYGRTGPELRVDVSVLELAEPVPATATPARLRLLKGADLSGRPWWAFGFPDDAGDDARGTIGIPLGYGTVRLDTTSASGLTQGFSGSAVWSPEYEAVVGLVVSAAQGDNAGSGRALTLFQADQELPEMKLEALGTWTAEAADDAALAAWGWTLQDDPEAGRHWLPRARGVAVNSERGYRFRGRLTALTQLTRWLDRTTPDGRVLVVTGSPGVGKSAVLGRVVTTADAEIRSQLPAQDNAVRGTVGSVSCAVHVKGKTALEVATEIARAASVSLPAEVSDLVPVLRDRLAARSSPFNLVVDALDEAVSPGQTRLLLGQVLLPLALVGVDLPVQVVVGTRRRDSEGDLLALFAGNATVIDLDDPRQFAHEDLAAYAEASLQLVGAERVGNPYAESRVAGPVSQRIATLAERNFLVAGLVARAHGLHDTEPIAPSAVTFTPTVDAALDAYLDGLAPAGRTPAQLALAVLAYAEAPGLPLPLWRAGVAALGGEVTEEQLAAFARTTAANFLIETSGDPAGRAYRLFHQALNDALLRGRDGVPDDERRLVHAWIHYGQMAGWPAAPGYLLRWLPTHAQRARRVDDLLADDRYLMQADLRRLMTVAESGTTDLGRARTLLLQRTPQAVDATPTERAAMFSVTQTLDGLASEFAAPMAAPYVGCWAHTPPRLERTVLEGHTDGVLGVCAVRIGGRTLLGSAGEDHTVRLWDPTNGQTERVLSGHDDRVRAMCAVRAGGRSLLASASEDHTVRLWDPSTGLIDRVLTGHQDWVRAVCAVTVGGRSLVASASDDRTVRLWDPATGSLERVLTGHSGWVTSVCGVSTGGRDLLASAGYDGTVRLWDPMTGEPVGQFAGHAGWVSALCPLSVGGRDLLASAGYDGTVRLWDLVTGDAVGRRGNTDRPITGVCAVPAADRLLLAWTGEDGAVRLWDPQGDAAELALTGHTGWVTAVCSVPVGERDLLASASEDGTVRLWDPDTGQPERVLDGGRTGPVAEICAVSVEEPGLVAATSDDGSVKLWDSVTGTLVRTLSDRGSVVTSLTAVQVAEGRCLALGGDGAIRLWDPRTDEVERRFDGESDTVTAVCAVSVDGRQHLASVGDDGCVTLWNPERGEIVWRREGHMAWVRGVCAVPGESGELLASASHDGTVRLWDPATGTLQRTLSGHYAAVTNVCAIPADGEQLLASASADRTVRLWHPESGRPGAILQGHLAEVTGLCAVPVGGHQLLASASIDRTVRLWDPATGGLRQTIPLHHAALTCQYVSGRLMVGLDTGILAIAFPG